MLEEKSLSIIDKLRETKERLEKKIEPKRKYGAGEALKKYWEDVRSGKRKLWSKNKVYDKATKKWVEKKEEPKPEEAKKEEIKLEKKPFDKESEEIKKELEEKVTDEKVLEKKETEVEVVERKKELKGFELKGFFKGITSDWIIIGFVGILIIILGMRYLSSKSSPQPSTPEPPQPQQKYREFDIGTRIIKIPIK